MEPMETTLAGGYGPPGGGYPPPPGGFGPPGGGGYGPPGGAPPGGYGGPPPGGGYGGPPPGGFGPPPAGMPGGFGPPGMMPMGPPPGGDVNTTLPLILNIVGLFIGCCSYGIGSLFGIIGLVLTIIAMSGKATNPEDARGKAKLGLIFGIISLVVGPLLIILFMMLGAFANLMENM